MNEPQRTHSVIGKNLAVLSEGLYLLNLLLQLIPLMVLAWLYVRHRNSEIALLGNHVRQTFFAALIASTIFLCAGVLVFTFGDNRTMSALIVFEIYYLVCVPLMLIPGLFGLLRAMAGQEYRYPLIGRILETGETDS